MSARVRDGFLTVIVRIIGKAVLTAVGVGAHGEGEAPIEHGMVWIVPLRFFERGYRFGKVVAEGQTQTLIEEFLSNSGLRRDFSPVGTDVIDEHRVLPG